MNEHDMGGPRVGKCTVCHHEDYLYSIRGEERCLHCNLDRIWDFMEGTRRMVESLMRVR